MRTTLTLEPDVGARLEKLRRQRKLSTKAAVNTVLRQGRAQMDAPSRPPKPFETDTVDLGNYRIPLDDVAEALAEAEGDSWR
ncbi:MAG: CopG family transcriptional regulator [Kiritimatiellia bacterium]